MMNKKQPKPTASQIAALYGVTPDFKTELLPDWTPKPKQKRTKSTKETEHKLQRRVVTWFRKQYPNLKDCLCYNDTNKTDATAQMIAKSMGLVTGRNDLSLYYRGRALLLELKIESGRQSESQKQFEKSMNDAGNHYRIAWEFEQATEIIRNFVTWCEKSP